MTIAYVCVLIVILLPYVWAYFAKKSQVLSGVFDNRSPRDSLASLKGPEQRANWAQQNAYESLPGFIAAVIIAHLTGAPQIWIDVLAICHTLARIAFGVCYIANLATARSIVWSLGLLSVIGLFVISF
jgi:Predicted membrane protein